MEREASALSREFLQSYIVADRCVFAGSSWTGRVFGLVSHVLVFRLILVVISGSMCQG